MKVNAKAETAKMEQWTEAAKRQQQQLDQPVSSNNNVDDVDIAQSEIEPLLGCIFATVAFSGQKLGQRGEM